MWWMGAKQVTAFNRTFPLWTGCANKIDFQIGSVCCIGWKAEDRTDFKLALLDCKWPHRDSSSTSYVADERIDSRRTSRLDVAFVPPHRRRWLSVVCSCQPSTTELFRSLQLASEIVCRSTSRLHTAPFLPVFCSCHQTTSALSAGTVLLNCNHLCHARQVTPSFSSLTYLLIQVQDWLSKA